jgi:hypothetical protein
MENFDYPQMNPNCIERRDSIVALQALQLMNGGMVHVLAEKFAQRVIKDVGTDQEKRIERIYLLALSRFPNDEERQIGVETLKKLEAAWAKEAGDANRKALTTYCHTLMNSAGFLYVD